MTAPFTCITRCPRAGASRGQKRLVIASAVILAALAGVVTADAAAPVGVYQGKASALLPSSIDWYPPLQLVESSTSSLTAGPRKGLRASAGANYETTPECSTGTARCTRVQLRVLVFQDAAGARTHWNTSCPSCSFGRDQDGWIFKREPDVGKIVGLCGNLVLAAQGEGWGDGRYAREAVGRMVESAESQGMPSCDPIKQEPSPAVFARGTATNPRKAVASGSIARPAGVVLRVKSGGFGEFYVEWTLTCLKGTRTETTSDEGLTTLPLLLRLPIGIAGASRCSATASAQARVKPGYAPTGGSVVVELLRSG